MKEMMKLSISLRGKSQNDLLQLPPMRNSIKSATLQILNLLFMSSYQARSPYTPLVAVRAMMITLRYGLHEASSVAFATYAMVLCGLNLDVKAARRYGEIAITLAESKHSREHTPIVYYLFGSGVSHWTGPIRATYKDLVYASKTAMEVGDAEIAVLAKTTKCIHALFSGVKLCDVEDELAQCIRTARLYRKQSTQTLCLITLQLIKCWMGETDNPATLTGRCINLNDIIKECENAHNHAWLSIIHLYSMDLAYSFGEYEEALRMAGGCHDQKHCAMFTCIETIYKEGLTAVAVARTGVNKGKNLKIAKENLKRLTAWSKDSSTTLLPKQLLLEAEILSLRGCKAQGKIDLLYEKALQHSLSLDFKKEAALVAERFADYRLRCGDKMEAIDLYIRSIDLYSGWGAEAKCIRLKSYVSTLRT